MAMAVRQARRQLQFTGFEMALIAVSFLVTVTTVFFLGLFVGKTNASYHAPTEDRVARIPVDDFTRYKRPEPIARPAKESKAATTATADSEVAAASSAKVPVAPAGTTAEVKVASVPAEPVGPAPVAEPAAKSAAVPAPVAAPAADTKAKDAAAKEAAAKEAAAAKAKAKEEEKAEPESTGRGYTVQILATRKEADADALLKKLKSRGLAAYVKKVGDGDGSWYRVRVGSYGAFSEAKGMADKVRRDLGLGQAFVSTE